MYNSKESLKMKLFQATCLFTAKTTTDWKRCTNLMNFSRINIIMTRKLKETGILIWKNKQSLSRSTLFLLRLTSNMDGDSQSMTLVRIMAWSKLLIKSCLWLSKALNRPRSDSKMISPHLSFQNQNNSIKSSGFKVLWLAIYLMIDAEDKKEYRNQ